MLKKNYDDSLSLDTGSQVLLEGDAALLKHRADDNNQASSPCTTQPHTATRILWPSWSSSMPVWTPLTGWWYLCPVDGNYAPRCRGGITSSAHQCPISGGDNRHCLICAWFGPWATQQNWLIHKSFSYCILTFCVYFIKLAGFYNIIYL